MASPTRHSEMTAGHSTGVQWPYSHCYSNNPQKLLKSVRCPLQLETDEKIPSFTCHDKSVSFLYCCIDFAMGFTYILPTGLFRRKFSDVQSLC